MNLSRYLMTGIAAATLAFGFSNAVHAQDANGTLRVQKPFRIKLGAYFPSDSFVKDTYGSTFFTYGVSYDFAKTKATNPVLYSLYVDGATGSRSQSVYIRGDYYDADLRFSYVGVGPSLRAMLSPATNSTRWFAGVGIGAYFIHRRVSVDVGDFNVSQSANDTRFGGKVFTGVEFGKGFFGELDYTYIGEIDDQKPGGFTVAAGYRF